MKKLFPLLMVHLLLPLLSFSQQDDSLRTEVKIEKSNSTNHCIGIKKNGKPCNRLTNNDAEYCWEHQNQAKMIYLLPVSTPRIDKQSDTTIKKQDTKILKKHDSIDKFVIALSYQPVIGVDFIGAGIYLHNIVTRLGLYGSMSGIRKEISGDQTSPEANDILILSTGTHNWTVFNFGITLETANNFFLYFGYSTGGYSNWITSKYLHLTTKENTTYTVVEEEKGYFPGLDFGGIYYAGTGLIRFGLQLGFNTSMQSISAGLHMGIFINK